MLSYSLLLIFKSVGFIERAVIYFKFNLSHQDKLSLFYLKQLPALSVSFGDEGLTAYCSGLIALDNIGLGSSLVAKEGMSL